MRFRIPLDPVEIRVVLQLSHIRAGVSSQIGRVDDTLVDSAHVAVSVVTYFSRDIEVRTAIRLETHVCADCVRRSVAAVVTSVGTTHAAAGRIFLQDDIDDTRNRVSPVLGGRALGQNFDMIDRIDRDEVEIDAGSSLVG